ncbi:MAG: phage major capsid protein [Prevotellaceae bacterium]|nr:phage major capsid protein [Candidatus Colivivens equi]
MAKTYDFSGWATRNDLKCSDGRTIRHGAFKDCDGLEVPLVWNHAHNEPDNVLGHALLENRDEGVYCYGTFNDTSSGQVAKVLVQHGDIKALSIYANQLKQSANRDVMHGVIREVSLVHAGANPGAFIDTVIAHSDDYDEEAVIYTGEDLVLKHSEDESEIKNDTDDEEEMLEHKDDEDKENNKMAEKEKTVGDVFNELTEEQKTVVYALIGQALEGKNKEDANMKHNVFENDQYNDDEMIHAAMETIIADGKRCGSLKESFLQHADEYGIKDIDWLFPDAKNLTDKPGFIKRNPDAWVDVVMNGVHHTPFSRIKMMFADLREDEARAKGYAKKAQLKKEEVFGLIKRTVDPTTIYKKQKLDRDDIIDITDFDVVSWLKGEMRMMLDEEIARAILFGDGRTALDADKIDSTKIIPIVADAALYTINATAATNSAKDLIAAAVRGQNDYEGSGNTTMFVANSTVTEMLLIEDTNQHRLYKDMHELALACSVNKIVKVPDSIVPEGVAAVIVDLNDYNVGADKGGSVNMFDDFDIDYNQQKYLIETRCSGALTKPFSAIVIKKADAEAQG